uniref:Uncharacterized protein n=1 Tax=Anas platyrhynchos TaxID=8839 RepID=A0A8B9ZDR5_ANAPL
MLLPDQRAAVIVRTGHIAQVFSFPDSTLYRITILCSGRALRDIFISQPALCPLSAGKPAGHFKCLNLRIKVGQVHVVFPYCLTTGIWPTSFQWFAGTGQGVMVTR